MYAIIIAAIILIIAIIIFTMNKKPYSDESLKLPPGSIIGDAYKVYYTPNGDFRVTTPYGEFYLQGVIRDDAKENYLIMDPVNEQFVFVARYEYPDRSITDNVSFKTVAQSIAKNRFDQRENKYDEILTGIE